MGDVRPFYLEHLPRPLLLGALHIAFSSSLEIKGGQAGLASYVVLGVAVMIGADLLVFRISTMH